MAVNATMKVYTKFSYSSAIKLMKLDTDVLRCILLSSYNIGGTQTSAQFLSDIVTAGVGVEANGTGYTAGGVPLTSVTLTNSGLGTTLMSGNPSWNATGGTLTASYALFYDSQPGTPATNPLIGYWDFGGAVTSTNNPFTLNINPSGLVTFTAT